MNHSNELLSNQRCCPNPLNNPNCEVVINHKNRRSCQSSKRHSRNCHNCRYFKNRSKNNIEKLLLNEPESYYWIGFLLADGHFSNEHGVSLSLSILDTEHLSRFSNFIGSEKSDVQRGMIRCLAMNRPVVDLICNKFDINSRKTYNPPNIEVFKNISRDLLLSLIAGFIDGDGSIFVNSKNDKIVCLRIKCHSSWFDNLKYFADILSPRSTVKIDKRGYVILNLANTFELKKIKQEILCLDLPLLDRKWDRIDLENVTTHEQSEISKLKAFEMFNRKMTITQIAKEMGMCYKNIWKYHQKYKQLMK